MCVGVSACARMCICLSVCAYVCVCAFVCVCVRVWAGRGDPEIEREGKRKNERASGMGVASGSWID